MIWQFNCHHNRILLRASTLLNEVETKYQSSYQLGCLCALWRHVPWGIAVGSLLSMMIAPLSLHVIEEHQHCLMRRGKGICQAISACCSWTLWQHIGGCAVQYSMDEMVWQLHCHHHCISLRSINVAQESSEVSVQLPTWLPLCFVRACTMEYCRLILAGCDDSFIVISCHQGALISPKEERQRDLPRNPSLLRLNFMTALHVSWSIAVSSLLPMMIAPLSLHVIEEHQHWLRRQPL